MTHNRFLGIAIGLAILTITILFLSYAPNSCTDDTYKYLVDDKTTSSNLRDFYNGNTEDKITAHVGKVGIALVETTGIKQVPIDHAFKSGDKFRFLVSTNNNGYLYLFHRSSDKNLQQLWPMNNTSDTFEIRSGQTYTIPPSPSTFIFDQEVGEEQFYIVVRSEAKVPNLGDFEDTEKQNQSANSLAISEKPKTQEVEWIIRGDPFGEGSTRGVIFDPGTTDGDLYRYFSAPPDDTSTKAMVQIILEHNQQ